MNRVVAGAAAAGLGGGVGAGTDVGDFDLLMTDLVLFVSMLYCCST